MHDYEIVVFYIFLKTYSVPHVFTFSLSAHTQAHTHRHAFFLSIYSYLKSPHIPWVSCCLQTILVAFQEKLQEEPAKVNKGTHVCTSATKKSHERIVYMIICYPETR